MRALGPTWLHRPPRRLGLRARVTTAFTLSALVLSVILATITYTATRSAILQSEAAAARRQTYVNASFLRRALPNSHQPSQLLSTLGTNASTSILSYQGAWHAYPLLVQRTLPESLRSRVLGGDAAQQYFVLPDGHPALGVGVPIAADQAYYFEVFDLQTVGHTLGILALAVAAAAAATTLLGAAAGGELSRRALAPLAKTARVAEEIAGGQLEARLAADDDVDLRPLAESFNTMVDALERRIRRDTRFASDVAHELRTPLTTLSNTLAVLEGRRGELSPRGQRALDLLSSEIRQFERLVQDLLEVSRYDAGVVERSFEPLQLDELVGQVLAHQGDQEVPLVVDPGAEDLLVLGDKRRLERVVTNLVSNADSHGGGVVGVGVQRRGDRARLSVDDAGPGVPAEERERVFERFARGPMARRRLGTEGVGLGLSLVAEHIALHQGSVWVEDRPGGGARFVVELPVAHHGEAAAGYPASSVSPP